MECDEWLRVVYELHVRLANVKHASYSTQYHSPLNRIIKSRAAIRGEYLAKLGMPCDDLCNKAPIQRRQNGSFSFKARSLYMYMI